MAMYAAIFDKPEGQNWLKQWRAVYITRKALLPTVSTEASKLHGYLSQRAQIQSISACTICTSRDVQTGVASCQFHKCFRDELVNEHAYGYRDGPRALALKHTKAENWAQSSWEIAKVFMPPSGYQNKTTIEETDFNGIAGFIINCKRFQSSITNSICEKAREAVNHIRHMPDMCASVLTDQATTECIDNLYALLHEPGLQNLPEVVQARNELDKLKTADLSKDENVCKYICQELHDEFHQRLDDIELKLQSKEFDTQTAKDSIRKESDKIHNNLELIWEAFVVFSDDLSKNKSEFLMFIKDERKRAMDHIAFLERRATENLEKYVTDGKKTLETHVKEERKRATEHIEQSVEKGQRALEDQTDVLVQRLRKEEDETLQQSKLDLQKQLLNHYQATDAVRIKVRLDFDAAVEDIYEKPKLKKTKKDKYGKITEEYILKIDQIFLSDNDMMAKTIFVEGEPGTGKSSLCKKIVDDWCKLKEDGTGETKEDSLLSQFVFLFYIRLREVEDRCNIKDMILQCLIEQIHSDYKESTELLAEILKTEYCLLLLDGLDEWKHGSCKRDERIPHVETGWLKCTTLITTRPYKLAELKVTRLKLGNHVKMQGVQSPRKLVRRVIQELKKDEGEKRPNTCVKDLKKKGLWHFRGIPIVLVHVVWLWFRNKLKPKMSQSEVYREIIEERWCEMNDKTKIKDNDLPKEFLDSLSELAFNKLFSANKDDSIVFGIKEGQLKKEYQRMSLESGIMSCSNKIGERSASYQFLHKTLQEYLAALFLANRGSDLFEHCQHVQELYKDNMKEGVLNLTQTFLFLCGLNTTAAEVFSKTLNDLFSKDFERDGYSVEHARILQSMLLKGYKEAEKNGHTGMELMQQHIVVCNRHDLVYWDFDTNDDYDDDDDDFYGYCDDDYNHDNDYNCNDDEDFYDGYDYNYQYHKQFYDYCGGNYYFDDEYEAFKKRMTDWCGKKKSNIVSLNITIPYVPSVLRYKNDPSILDLEKCINLKFLHLKNVPCEDINLLNLNGLLECEIKFIRNVCAVKLVTSILSSNITCLKKLTLKSVDLQCKAEDIFCKLQRVEHISFAGSSLSNNSQLDLVHLKHLKTLSLRGLAFSDVVIPHLLNLHELKVMFTTHQRALQLMTALLAQSDDSLGYTMDGPLSNLEHVSLASIVMSAGMFTRLVSIRVMQARHSVECKLDKCTIESEEDVRQMGLEMENQPDLQMVAPMPASPDYTTFITLSEMTVSAGMFTRLVSMVIQARHSVRCTLEHCTIESEDDVRQMEDEMEYQSTLQMVALLPASPDYTKYITLACIPVLAGVFIRLVSMVIQTRHSVKCRLKDCTIESEEDMRHLNAKTKYRPALQMVSPLPASPDYKTSITITEMTVSAEMIRILVSMVIQARHSANCTFNHGVIKYKEDFSYLYKIYEHMPALQIVAPLLAPPNFFTHITITSIYASAVAFRSIVSMAIQARHSVNCTLDDCTIESEEESRQMEVETENQPGLQVVDTLPASPGYTTRITLKQMSVSAGLIRRLVSMVIQARHYVDCTLDKCRIKSEEESRQMEVETENQPVLQMVDPLPASPDYTTHIKLTEMYLSAGLIRRLFSMVIQARHSVNCTLDDCTIESEEEWRQMEVETENQPGLQVVDTLPASPDYETHIGLSNMSVSAGLIRRLVSMVIQARHYVDCSLYECTAYTYNEISQMKAEMESQPLLKVREFKGYYSHTSNGTEWSIRFSVNM